jgi:hypothetical protein
MEAEAFRAMASRWKGGGQVIRCVAHDQDSKVSRLMKDLL